MVRLIALISAGTAVLAGIVTAAVWLLRKYGKAS